ncbi:protein translocase subunit SecD [Pelolinea submarina]|uniref:Protein translocase subunit SecD n=1 Tax=Pelolinea submarina TaxID=913107 RepID=A0A347ZTH9_9CHLR|nr:protein translocase subunit SecD [Pelolinea submarina]REG10815.1 preprotein translocase subunit SecD [Pelolinea submarina]BBB48610.1 preprotein translocase subunit SecD [Pelolinea submarina]
MKNKALRNILIIVVVILVILIDFPILGNVKQKIFNRDVTAQLGLDLRGGMQVVLQAPEGYQIDQETLQVASSILENRANALGVSEVLFQVAGDNYIVGEFPGLENIDEVISVIKQTGMLEFVDVGDEYLEPGTVIQTDYTGTKSGSTDSTSPEAAATVAPEATTTVAATEAAAAGTDTTAADAAAAPATDKIYHTVITGADLEDVFVTAPQTPTDGYAVSFKLKSDATQTFADYTTNNVGKMLAIVLDHKIVSTPVIHQAITSGEGAISGSGENAYTYDEANNLRITLFYGTLPVSLEIAESRVVGPTLGQDSLNKSLLAAAIGFLIISLFMLIYYRVPGFVAIISITIFGLITYAIYLVIPVTLTLPGIAGFLLSVGSALDANILQFERLKEELRRGRNLQQAVDLGWSRAWPSIRDSNLATLITSAILFWFGSTFGASIVKGFALTLAIGVVISLFTALFVTRTLLSSIIDRFKDSDKAKWFGI